MASALTAVVAQWEELGPHNIFNYDDVSNGWAGTCHDAVSLPSSPATIYLGGSNNAASSGVYKTTNFGKNWVKKNNGLADTRIYAFCHDPNDVNHLYVSTPSGLFGTTDGAESWSFVQGTQAYGIATTFVTTTINGVNYCFGDTSNGVSYTRLDQVSWTISKPPTGQGVFSITANADHIYTEAGGDVWRIIYSQANGPVWQATNMKAIQISVDPFNPLHLLAGHPAVGDPSLDYRVVESLDGGDSMQVVAGNCSTFWMLFDTVHQGMTYSGGNGNWEFNTDNQRECQATKNRNLQHFLVYPNPDSNLPPTKFGGVGHDWQKFLSNFGTSYIAACSDQGLYVLNNPDDEYVVGLNGDLRINIAVSVAVSRVNGVLQIVQTSWDYAPMASWDGGATWPNWGDSLQSPNSVGEGGEVYTFGNLAKNMVMTYFDQMWYSADGGKHWVRSVALPAGYSAGYRAFSWATNNGLPTGVAYISATSQSTGKYRADDGYYFAKDHCKHAKQNASEFESLRLESPRNDLYHVLATEDFGASWALYSVAALPDSVSGDGDNFVKTRAVPNSRQVFVVGRDCLTSSTDGRSWAPCSNPCGAPHRIIDLAIHPKDPARMVAFCDNGGGLHWPRFTADQGNTWTETGANANSQLAAVLAQNPRSQISVSFSPSGNTLVWLVFVTVGPTPLGHVFRSKDNGATWQDMRDGLVTMQLNQHTWGDADLYLATSGQGVLRYSNFDQ